MGEVVGIAAAFVLSGAPTSAEVKRLGERVRKLEGVEMPGGGREGGGEFGREDDGAKN